MYIYINRSSNVNNSYSSCFVLLLPCVTNDTDMLQWEKQTQPKIISIYIYIFCYLDTL